MNIILNDIYREASGIFLFLALFRIVFEYFKFSNQLILARIKTHKIGLVLSWGIVIFYALDFFQHTL